MTERESPRLGLDVFVALAAVGWADGKLDRDEADAIVRAAADEGLSLEELARVERATMEPVDVATLERSGMSREDRVFVYAMATWIATIDGVVAEEESTALSQLGEKLGVPDRMRVMAERVAREVAHLPDGDRPARYDLARVRRIIADKLSSAPKSGDRA